MTEEQTNAQRALDDGCQELDMVCNISQVLSNDWDSVRQDINMTALYLLKNSVAVCR